MPLKCFVNASALSVHKQTTKRSHIHKERRVEEERERHAMRSYCCAFITINWAWCWCLYHCAQPFSVYKTESNKGRGKQKIGATPVPCACVWYNAYTYKETHFFHAVRSMLGFGIRCFFLYACLLLPFHFGIECVHIWRQAGECVRYSKQDERKRDATSTFAVANVCMLCMVLACIYKSH